MNTHALIATCSVLLILASSEAQAKPSDQSAKARASAKAGTLRTSTIPVRGHGLHFQHFTRRPRGVALLSAFDLKFDHKDHHIKQVGVFHNGARFITQFKDKNQDDPFTYQHEFMDAEGISLCAEPTSEGLHLGEPNRAVKVLGIIPADPQRSTRPRHRRNPRPRAASQPTVRWSPPRPVRRGCGALTARPSSVN